MQGILAVAKRDTGAVVPARGTFAQSGSRVEEGMEGRGGGKALSWNSVSVGIIESPPRTSELSLLVLCFS